MEEFKIKNWEKEKLNLEYTSLNKFQNQQIITEIANKYSLLEDSLCDSAFFIKVSEIFIKKNVLLSINDHNGFKDLISMLNLNVSEDSYVNVIWNSNCIDQFKCYILNDYWDYIWYGPSDEMCLLYFSEIQFLILITDYGTIYQ